MCKKLFRYKKILSKEKNIRIREREEEFLKWSTDLIFTITLGGGIITYFEVLRNGKTWLVILTALISLSCLFVGLFIATKIVPYYHVVTNKLIVDKEKGTKTKRRKR